jgi:hypothetical protein
MAVLPAACSVCRSFTAFGAVHLNGAPAERKASPRDYSSRVRRQTSVAYNKIARQTHIIVGASAKNGISRGISNI